MKRFCLVLLACLAVSACGDETFSDRVHQVDDDGIGGGCASSGKGSRSDQEAKERQCRADQTQARVDRQQILHDEGMARPFPW